MKPEEIIKMAREAGLTDAVLKFADLVSEAERKARQLAQAENEELKAQLARAGLDAQRAVLAKQEEIAALVDLRHAQSRNHLVRSGLAVVALDIRELGKA